MMTEKQITELDSKIKNKTINKTDEIIQKQEQQILECHRTLIGSIVSAVDMLNVINKKGKKHNQSNRDRGAGEKSGRES